MFSHSPGLGVSHQVGAGCKTLVEESDFPYTEQVVSKNRESKSQSFLRPKPSCHSESLLPVYCPKQITKSVPDENRGEATSPSGRKRSKATCLVPYVSCGHYCSSLPSIHQSGGTYQSRVWVTHFPSYLQHAQKCGQINQ